MTSDFQVGIRQVGQAPSDFTKLAYVVKYLIREGRQVKNALKTSDVLGVVTSYSLSERRKEKEKKICAAIKDFTNLT